MFNHLVSREENPRFVASAHFPGVNTLTVAEFQATKVMSLNMELGKDVHSHIVSVQALAPTHHG